MKKSAGPRAKMNIHNEVFRASQRTVMAPKEYDTYCKHRFKLKVDGVQYLSPVPGSASSQQNSRAFWNLKIIK